MKRCDACMAEANELATISDEFQGIAGVEEVCRKCQENLDDTVSYTSKPIQQIRRRARRNAFRRAVLALRNLGTKKR